MKVEYLTENRIAMMKISPTLTEELPLVTKAGVEELYNALLRADRDEGVHRVIIAAEGDFGGGADLKELMSISDVEEAIRWLETY